MPAPVVVESGETHEIHTDADVVRVRQAARTLALAAKLSLVDQTKLVTAASELARNTVIHGGGGMAKLEVIQKSEKRGIRLTFDGPRWI